MTLNLAATLALLYIVGACLLVAFLCGIDRVIEMVTGRRRDIAPAEYRAAFPDDEPFPDMSDLIGAVPDEQWTLPLVEPTVPRFCPACVVIAREHDLDVIDEGFPKLCAHHIRTLAQWNKRQPGIMSTAITGLHLYAMRATPDDE